MWGVMFYRTTAIDYSNHGYAVSYDALFKLHPYVNCPQKCSSMYSRNLVHVVRGGHTEIRVKDQLTS